MEWWQWLAVWAVIGAVIAIGFGIARSTMAKDEVEEGDDEC